MDGRQRLRLEHPSKTAAQWGDIVRNADKDFTGTRPRIQLWHGTGDTTLTYSQNFPEEVLQWTNVIGVSVPDTGTISIDHGGTLEFAGPDSSFRGGIAGSGSLLFDTGVDTIGAGTVITTGGFEVGVGNTGITNVTLG